ncbi:unnamed protein product [Boreogadus saida]
MLDVTQTVYHALTCHVCYLKNMYYSLGGRGKLACGWWLGAIMVDKACSAHCPEDSMAPTPWAGCLRWLVASGAISITPGCCPTQNGTTREAPEAPSLPEEDSLKKKGLPVDRALCDTLTPKHSEPITDGTPAVGQNKDPGEDKLQILPDGDGAHTVEQELKAGPLLEQGVRIRRDFSRRGPECRLSPKAIAHQGAPVWLTDLLPGPSAK